MVDSPKMRAQQVDAEEISTNDTMTKNGHTIMNLQFTDGEGIAHYLIVLTTTKYAIKLAKGMALKPVSYTHLTLPTIYSV